MRYLVTIYTDKSILDVVIEFIKIFMPTLVGGLVTIWASRRFEFHRLRINNINDMHKVVLPAIQDMLKVLGKTSYVLKTLHRKEQANDLSAIVNNLQEGMFNFNSVIDSYEIELSGFLDQHEVFLALSAQIIMMLDNRVKKANILAKEVDSSYESELKILNMLSEILISLSEDVTELTRDALNGKVHKYWKKKLKPDLGKIVEKDSED